jgi:hypothetical protein
MPIRCVHTRWASESICHVVDRGNTVHRPGENGGICPNDAVIGFLLLIFALSVQHLSGYHNLFHVAAFSIIAGAMSMPGASKPQPIRSRVKPGTAAEIQRLGLPQ